MSRRSSPVWNYFLQLKSNTRKLRCKICKEIVPYTKTGTTSRLLRHAKKHSIHFHVQKMMKIKTDILEEDGQSNKAIQSSIQKPSKRKSKVWQCFNTLSSGSTDSQLDEGHARCKFCPRVLSFNNGSTGNLNRHIKTLHKPIWAILGRKSFLKPDKEVDSTHIIFSKQCEETPSSKDGFIQNFKCEKDLDDAEINDGHNQFGNQEQSRSLAKRFETEDTTLNKDSTINSIEGTDTTPANDTEEPSVIEEIYNDDFMSQIDNSDIAALATYSASRLKSQIKKNHRNTSPSAAVMRIGTQKWFNSRTNFIDTKTRCFLQEHRQKLRLQEIEHGEKMRLQEIEHSEKMKLLQLQQELLRKQIEVEHSKIAQKHDS